MYLVVYIQALHKFKHALIYGYCIQVYVDLFFNYCISLYVHLQTSVAAHNLPASTAHMLVNFPVLVQDVRKVPIG